MFTDSYGIRVSSGFLILRTRRPPTGVAHSEGHPHTEGTFTETLVNLGDLHRNSGECQGAYPEYDVVGSPKFAMLRQSSHEGARMLPVYPGICLNRSLRALRARSASASGSVRESVSKNRGVPESVWGSALGVLLKVT